MHEIETRFVRALTEGAEEANIDITAEDVAFLRAEHWYDYPEATRGLPSGPPEDAALALAGEAFNPDFRKHRRYLRHN